MYVNFNENPRGNYYAGDCVVRAINDAWDSGHVTPIYYYQKEGE